MSSKISTKVLCKCNHCGKEFYEWLRGVKRGRGKHCSQTCASADKKHGPKDFWNRVNKTGSCWIFTGDNGRYGHGRLKIGGRRIGAHRYSWELLHGPVPNGLCVLHNCPGGDNAACVNPAHLWLGTRGDNNRDTALKKQNYR
jgi:hypothetical protein